MADYTFSPRSQVGRNKAGNRGHSLGDGDDQTHGNMSFLR